MRARPRINRAGAITLVAGVVILLIGAVSVHRTREDQGSPAPRPGAVTMIAGRPSAGASGGPTGPAASTATDPGGDLTRLGGTPRYDTSPRTDLIEGQDSRQPDLFAAAFVRRLLTQDYRTPRADLLAWVQAESAQTTEPLVVGLVPPEMRDRFAVYSVTDTASGPAPVPSEDEWRILAAQGATTTAAVGRVLEPQAWSNAVDAGRIHDPGVTARQVQATVTRHLGTVTSSYSVEVIVNLEGPPTRDRWGFVTLLTYTSIPTGTP